MNTGMFKDALITMYNDQFSSSGPVCRGTMYRLLWQLLQSGPYTVYAGTHFINPRKMES